VVLLEAMASGTAVVASDLTGYRHVARGGREAVLVAPGDAVALRAGLRRVLDDPSGGADLVAHGRDRSAEFSMSALAEAFVERYEVARAAGSMPMAGSAPLH
jgi:phosphatidylinositol alpha-mannosyltransferase